MTRKDYEAIATVFCGASDFLKESLENPTSPAFVAGYNSAIEAISQGLIYILEEDNPRFDSERFLRACGL